MDENGDCFVDDFTVGREGYGNIFFHGPINVANLNLDDIGKKHEIGYYMNNILGIVFVN